MSRKQSVGLRKPAPRRRSTSPSPPPRAIANVRLLGEPAWTAALAGDAAAAIGAALRAALDPRCGSRRRQLTIAALEICALAGDPAARIVLAHLTRRPR